MYGSVPAARPTTCTTKRSEATQQPKNHMPSACVLLPKAKARRCGRGRKAPAACRGHSFPSSILRQGHTAPSISSTTPNPSSCSSAVQAMPCRSLVPHPTCRLQDVDGRVVVMVRRAQTLNPNRPNPFMVWGLGCMLQSFRSPKCWHGFLGKHTSMAKRDCSEPSRLAHVGFR